MKIKLTTENITGLSKEILSMLATYELDIRRIEVETGLMYLSTEEIDKHIEREIASKLMTINGVKWVENISLMPVNERNLFLNAILNAVSDPVFGINNKGEIIYKNSQAIDTFEQSNQKISDLKDIFTEPHWTNQIDSAASNTLPVNIKTIAGSMLVEVRGINLEDKKPIGAVLIFHKPENIAARSHIIQSSEIQGFDGLAIADKQMVDLINRAKQMNKNTMPLVIYGESGVGKKTIAQAIHFSGLAKNKLFTTLNCAAVKPSQIDTNLFGLADPSKGKAGILEIADGGTVYIEAINEMPEQSQLKLLQFIQTGNFNRVGGKIKRQSQVKIIASSPQVLQNFVDNKRFNSDLMYALEITQLHIPALRQRKDDIEPLTVYFLNVFKSQGGKDVNELSFTALNKIKSYFWPGNIAQLKDILYKASLLTESTIIEAEHIEIDGHVHIESHLDNRSLPQAVAEFEKHFLQHWYQKYPSTRKLAHKLGVSHTTIAQKINKYAIS